MLYGLSATDLTITALADTNSITITGAGVDFLQQKTSRKVTVGVINPMAIHILTQDFPKRMYPERFNKQLKLVLKEAGLTQMVKAHRYNGKTK